MVDPPGNDDDHGDLDAQEAAAAEAEVFATRYDVDYTSRYKADD